MKRQDEMYRGEIGEIIHVFRSSKGNILAGLILAALMLVGGGVSLYSIIKGIYIAGGKLPFHAQRGWCWLAVILGSGIAIFLIYLGASVIRFSGRYLATYQVRIGETGLDVEIENRYLCYTWNEIRQVTEVHYYHTFPVIAGTNIGPELGSRIFVVSFKDGELFSFGQNEVKEHMLLASYLKYVADNWDIPWEIVEKHH